MNTEPSNDNTVCKNPMKTLGNNDSKKVEVLRNPRMNNHRVSEPSPRPPSLSTVKSKISTFASSPSTSKKAPSVGLPKRSARQSMPSLTPSSQPKGAKHKGPDQIAVLKRCSSFENKFRKDSSGSDSGSPMVAPGACVPARDSRMSKPGIIGINSIGLAVPIKEINSLKMLFDDIDSNGNGTIEAKEFNSYAVTMRAKGMSDSKNVGISLIKQLGDHVRDPNALVTFKDFLRVAHGKADEDGIEAMFQFAFPSKVAAKRHSIEPEEDDMEDLNEMWAKWDIDEKNILSEFQFRELLESIGHEDPADWDDFMDEIGISNRGIVTKDEFSNWWFKDLLYKE